MKSPIKQKLMRALLDGELHREIDLATSAGFTKVATIRKWIDAFEAAKFIERRRDELSGGYRCQIIRTKESVRKIYQYPEFRALCPEIRNASWVCPLFTEKFSVLPDDLPVLIDGMVRASHSFFAIICRYDSPEKIRETFEPVLLLNRLAGIRDPLFNDRYLYHGIFVQSVIRDIDHGGLGPGFAALLEESRQALVEAYGKSGGLKMPGRERIARPGAGKDRGST